VGQYRSTLNSKKRKRVKKALFAKSSLCYVCQRPIPSIEMATIEHIIPLSKGGTSRVDNLSLSHRSCNQMKADTIMEYSPSCASNMPDMIAITWEQWEEYIKLKAEHISKTNEEHHREACNRWNISEIKFGS
jgi:hypothetical protein